MTKYKVNQEGIEALNGCSQALKQAVEQLGEIAQALKGELSGNQQGAGPHYEEIQEIADEISASAKTIEEPVDEVCESLGDLAESYQDIIDSKLGH